MYVRIGLELGHSCEQRQSLGNKLTMDWKVWVRGASGCDISEFVQKVFFLHSAGSIARSKRVLEKPPYETKESGSESLNIPIHVYLKYSKAIEKIRLRYYFQVEDSKRNSSGSRIVFYEFQNPSEELTHALLRGGGILTSITRPLKRYSYKHLTIFPDHSDNKQKKITSENYMSTNQSRTGTKGENYYSYNDVKVTVINSILTFPFVHKLRICKHY